MSEQDDNSSSPSKINQSVAETSNIGSLTQNLKVENKQQSSLSQNPFNTQSKLKTFFYEFIAMFVFVYGITCPQGQTQFFVDLQVIVCLVICVSISARFSGANINPSITLSHCLKKTHKLKASIYLVYLAAQFAGAFLALSLTEVLNDHSLPAPVPINFEALTIIRIIISEMMGTSILIFFVLQLTDVKRKQPFIDDHFFALFFISLYVFIGIKFAPNQGVINPMILLCSSIVEATKGATGSLLKYWWIWLFGDFLGVLLGVSFYDKLYEPNSQVKAQGPSEESDVARADMQ